MPDKPKTYAVIDTEMIREHGVEYPSEELARAALGSGEAVVQLICSVEALVTEYRRRDVASKDAKAPEPLVDAEP